MLNTINLVGFLANEPDLRAMLTGGSICRFQVAVTRPKNANGDQGIDFIDVVTMDGRAEFINKYFKKGDVICLSGRLQTQVMVDEDGRSRKVAEVMATQVDFLPRKAEAPKQEELF